MLVLVLEKTSYRYRVSQIPDTREPGGRTREDKLPVPGKLDFNYPRPRLCSLNQSPDGEANDGIAFPGLGCPGAAVPTAAIGRCW